MSEAAVTAPITAGTPAWAVVAGRELLDLWLTGRGLVMMLAHTSLLSLTTYLVAINQELNFLEQREAVSLTMQVTLVVGGLLALLAAADSVSGERERGTLEALLLTAAPRRSIVVGKALSACSLWVGAFLLSLPYLWWLGRDVGTFDTAVLAGAVVGSLLTVFLVGVGLVVSLLSGSNALSLSVSFFVLLALYAPSQMPTGAVRGWLGELLLRVDPVTSGLLFVERLLIDRHGFAQDVSLLLFPLVLALAAMVVVWLLAARLSLLVGGRS